MKKDLFKWMTIFMVAIMSVGFVSCDDDDDVTANVSIVGIWECSDGDMFYRLIFNENGTGHDLAIWKGHVDYEADFTYKYDSKTMTVSIKEDGEEGSVKIKGLTEKTLIIELLDTDKEGNKIFRSYTRK